MVATARGPILFCRKPATMNIDASDTMSIVGTHAVWVGVQWNSFSSAGTKTLQA